MGSWVRLLVQSDLGSSAASQMVKLRKEADSPATVRPGFAFCALKRESEPQPEILPLRVATMVSPTISRVTVCHWPASSFSVWLKNITGRSGPS